MSTEWPVSSSTLARLLGLSLDTLNTHRRRLTKTGDLVEGTHFDRRDLGVKNAPGPMIAWFKEGAIQVAQRCRKRKAKDFLVAQGHRFTGPVAGASVASDVLCAALDGLTVTQREHLVDRYRVDLFLPELGIAIEFDEDDHRSYSRSRENARKMRIRQVENCRFVRLDPSDPVQLGGVINEIIKSRDEIIGRPG